MEREVTYISGKISAATAEGVQENLDAFLPIGARLLQEGHPVILPGENLGRVGIEAGLSWKDFMRADIEIMRRCDTLHMMENWKESRGARLENRIAKFWNMPITYEADLPKGE